MSNTIKLFKNKYINKDKTLGKEPQPDESKEMSITSFWLAGKNYINMQDNI